MRLVAPHPVLPLLPGVVLLADLLQSLADRQRVGALPQHVLQAQLGGVAQAAGAEGREGEAEIHPTAAAALREGGRVALLRQVGQGVEPAVGRHRLALAQQLQEGARAAAGRLQAAALPDSRERDAEAVEVAAQGGAVGIEIARHHADPLRRRAAVEQGADPGGDLPRLGVGPHGLQAGEIRRSRPPAAEALSRRRTNDRGARRSGP